MKECMRISVRVWSVIKTEKIFEFCKIVSTPSSYDDSQFIINIFFGSDSRL